MNGDTSLTELQIETLRMFFDLPESTGFILAGGAALLAQELTDRPTYDLDFFSAPGKASVPSAADAIERSAGKRGWPVHRVQDSETFCRLQLEGMDDLLLVDLAIDAAPRHATIETSYGPSYQPLELAGRKLIALFDRAEARDFADVHRLAQRFGREELLEQAAQIDLGFDRKVLAEMMLSLDRFADNEIPMPSEAVGVLRAYFQEWAHELR